MPIYQYKDLEGNTFEIMQSIKDAPLTEHPDTGVPIVKVVVKSSFILKGSGFYNTDYKNKN